MGMGMQKLPNAIFQQWLHSYEEDGGDIKVYRPMSYDFPPARGRTGLEFKPDGTVVDLRIGPADAHQGIDARWQTDSAGRLRITYPGNARASLLLEVVQADENVLKVRQKSPMSP
jgi:hypothetical protein